MPSIGNITLMYSSLLDKPFCTTVASACFGCWQFPHGGSDDSLLDVDHQGIVVVNLLVQISV